MSEPIAVIGAGAWGTALAVHLARNGRQVRLWARDPGRAAAMQAQRENTAHLPGQPLPPGLLVTADAALALRDAALALLVVPAQHLRTVLATLPALPPSLICAKGVEQGTLRLPTEILADSRPDLRTGILSGPNFARDVAAGLPAAAVLASTDAALRETAVALCSGSSFRLYAGDDPIAAEVAGAAKNVIAIAAGAVTGAGLGENARAALITRGLAEISRLAIALGGRAETVAGLSGLGDLLLTCTGAGSRNFSLGFALGQGRALQDILAERNSVTEGVATAPALVARAAQAGVELPIAEAVAAVLSGELALFAAVDRLLTRPLRRE